jgi:hypothetical protein
MALFAAVAQKLADPLLFAIIAGMAAFGHSVGAFVGLLSALQVLLACFAALGLLDWMTVLAADVGCPEEWCGVAAFLVVFVVVWAVTRVAIGSRVKEDSVRFPPPFDGVAGAVAGGLAGMILSASALVALSMMPLPEEYRLKTSELRLDLAPRLLAAFGGIATTDADARGILLDGEPGFEYVPPEPEEPPADDSTGGQPADPGTDAKANTGIDPDPDPDADEGEDADEDEDEELPILWGEPFVDSDGNGAFDAGEPFLDTDGDGFYTEKREEDDRNGNGIRDIGLVERYRVFGGRWDRVIVVPPPEADALDDDAADENAADEEAMEEAADAQ